VYPETQRIGNPGTGGPISSLPAFQIYFEFLSFGFRVPIGSSPNSKTQKKNKLRAQEGGKEKIGFQPSGLPDSF
jgi:hypothetical protein